MNLPKVSSRTVMWRIWGLRYTGRERDALRRNGLHLCPLGCLFAALVETSYRIEYGSLSHLLNSLYLLVLMAASG